MNWYIKVLKNYTTFSGRARRKEYWFFFLINTIVAIGLGVVDLALGFVNPETGAGILGTLYALGVLLPSLAVTVRRLHDTGRTGWWLLIIFIPLIGALVLLVFMVLGSEEGTNEYGPSPLEEPEPASDMGS